MKWLKSFYEENYEINNEIKLKLKIKWLKLFKIENI